MHDYEKIETIRQILQESLAQDTSRLKEALRLADELLAKYKDPNQGESVKGDR